MRKLSPYGFDTESLEPYLVSAYLPDTYLEGQSGGTGRTFDWRKTVEAKRYGPVILSGGLTPANVRQAVTTVVPHGIDVNRGCEICGGEERQGECRTYLQLCKAADQENVCL